MASRQHRVCPMAAGMCKLLVHLLNTVLSRWRITLSKAATGANTKRWQQLGGSVESDVQDDKVSVDKKKQNDTFDITIPQTIYSR
jgi:hypothetical protein